VILLLEIDSLSEQKHFSLAALRLRGNDGHWLAI